MQLLLRSSLYLLVAVHFAVFGLNAIAMAWLIYNQPIWISLPLCTVLARAFFDNQCPLTMLENYIRVGLGKPTIGRSFRLHYLTPSVKVPCPKEEYQGNELLAPEAPAKAG